VMPDAHCVARGLVALALRYTPTLLNLSLRREVGQAAAPRQLPVSDRVCAWTSVIGSVERAHMLPVCDCAAWHRCCYCCMLPVMVPAGAHGDSLVHHTH
jgi:hypothetical protein